LPNAVCAIWFIGVAARCHAVHERMRALGLVDAYDHVLFLRIDLVVKEALHGALARAIMEAGRLESITFPFICWHRDHLTSRRLPRIADTLMLVRRDAMPLVPRFSLTHNSWDELVDLGVRPGVLLETLHDSNSENDLNPLYRMCNRPESGAHASPGWRFDAESAAFEAP
jgi:hypothetical protein